MSPMCTDCLVLLQILAEEDRHLSVDFGNCILQVFIGTCFQQLRSLHVVVNPTEKARQKIKNSLVYNSRRNPAMSTVEDSSPEQFFTRSVLNCGGRS